MAHSATENTPLIPEAPPILIALSQSPIPAERAPGFALRATELPPARFAI